MDCARSPSEKSHALLWTSHLLRSFAVSGAFHDPDQRSLIHRPSHRIQAKESGANGPRSGHTSRSVSNKPNLSVRDARYGWRRWVSIVLTTLRTVGCSAHRRSILRTALITVE